MASETHTSARTASNPRQAAWAKPFGIHGRVRAVGAPHAGSPAISIKIARNGVEHMLALRASKFKHRRHGTEGSASKAPNNIRIKPCVKMSRSMLLERAVAAKQARPRRELGRLEELNREPERRPLVRDRPAKAT